MTAFVRARPKGLAVGLLGAGLFAAIVLHLLAGYTFPVSWPDEIDFLTPAANLARHGSLDAPALNAPNGMLWVPDLYYLLLAPVFRVLPLTVEVGRAVSLTAMLLAAVGFWVAGTRAGAGHYFSAAVVAAWLVTPSAVLAGNIARQEAVVLAFVAWSTAATLGRRRTLAISLAGFAALTHPAGVAFAIVAVAANVGTADAPAPAARRFERVVAGLALAVAAFQVLHVVSHLDLALEHLRFQIDRKADRQAQVPTGLVLIGVGLAVAAVWRWRRDSRALLLGGLVALGAVCVVGQEMWYQIYGWPTAVMLLAIVGSASVDQRSLSAATGRAASALVVLAVPVLVAGAWATPFYGMRFRHQPSEWTAFVTAVETQLVAFSASSDEDQAVVVNDLSGLPWPLEAERVGRVRLIKETSTTRFTGTTPQIKLYARTLCCHPHAPVPAGEVISHVESPNGTYDATLLWLTPRPSRAASS